MFKIEKMPVEPTAVAQRLRRKLSLSDKKLVRKYPNKLSTKPWCVVDDDMKIIDGPFTLEEAAKKYKVLKDGEEIMVATPHQRETVEKAKLRIFGPHFKDAVPAQLTWSKDKLSKINDWLKKNTSKGMLVISGPPGVGKTYACAAFVDWLHPRTDNYRYWDERILFQKVRDGMKEGHDYASTLQYMMDYKHLIFNDFGSVGFDKESRSWREEVWLYILEDIINNDRCAIITTNLSKEELASKTHARMGSRIFNKINTIIDLDGEIDWRQQ